MSKQQGTDSIRISQVMAGALAAVTAALIGSTMGVAGTVVGAGVASVVSTVGGALYLRSIQRTGQGVRSVRERVVTRTGSMTVTMVERVPGEAPREESSGELDAAAGMSGVAAGSSGGEPDAAVGASVGGAESSDGESASASGGEAGVAAGSSDGESVSASGGGAGVAAGLSDGELGAAGERSPSAKRLGWPAMIVGSVLAFVLGMAVITGVEWLRGEPLSGGEGTTVGDIVRVRPGGEGEREDTPPPATGESSTPPSTGDSTVTVTEPPAPTGGDQPQSDPPSTPPTIGPTTTPPTTTGSDPADATSVPPSGPTG